MLLLDGEDYSPLLALIADAPPALAVIGDRACLMERAVAMVGARNASANGQRIAEELAAELAAAGLVVVSGMAWGECGRVLEITRLPPAQGRVTAPG